jgi:flagellar motor switch protein FliN/FliY
MPDMDENNKIEQQVSDENSAESPKDENAPAEGKEPEATPGEQDVDGMAGESAEEASPENEVKIPDEIPDGAGEAENLLDQNEIDNVLKNAGESEDNTDIPFDDGGDDFDGLSDPEVKQADFQQLSSTPVEGETKNIELLMDVELPISIELGKTKMNIADILGLAPGSIVELDKLVGEPVDLLVNQRCVAKSEVVVVEENFGLRITQLVSPEERLRNLQ